MGSGSVVFFVITFLSVNVMRLAVSPNETNPPLVVDANTVLPGAISLEHFEAVTWRNPKFPESPGCVEVEKLPPGDTLDRSDLGTAPPSLGSGTSGSRFSYDVPRIPSSGIRARAGS